MVLFLAFVCARHDTTVQRSVKNDSMRSDVMEVGGAATLSKQTDGIYEHGFNVQFVDQHTVKVEAIAMNGTRK